MADISPQSLVERLEAQLTPEALAALQTLRRLTDASSLDLYLVGGAVRDLVLQRDNVDLDLAIEADVAPIAETLASEHGRRNAPCTSVSAPSTIFGARLPSRPGKDAQRDLRAPGRPAGR